MLIYIYAYIYAYIYIRLYLLKKKKNLHERNTTTIYLKTQEMPSMKNHTDLQGKYIEVASNLALKVNHKE